MILGGGARAPIPAFPRSAGEGGRRPEGGGPRRGAEPWPGEAEALAEAAGRCRALWRAVLAAALDDARRTNDRGDDARAFLASAGCAAICEAAGVEPEALRAAAARARSRDEVRSERRARLADIVAASPGVAIAEAIAALVAEGTIGAHDGPAVRCWIEQGLAGVRVVRVRAGRRTRLRLEPEETVGAAPRGRPTADGGEEGA